MPLISIIIPHYNRSGLIGATLQSVYNQTMSDWEVIIVDDGSTPEEYSLLQSHADERVRILQREDAPKGPSRCRNIGLSLAKGKYALFLDSDDLLESTSLVGRYSRAQQYPSLDMWVFHYANFREVPGDVNEPWRRLDPTINHLEHFLTLDAPWCVTSCLWNTERLRALGGFNERIWYGDDAELHIHALLEGYRFKEFPEVTADCFVRRSEIPRTTNELSEGMIHSRLLYLDEVWSLMEKYPNVERNRRWWETAYFAEAEFLIFKRQYRSLVAVWLHMLERFSWWKASAICWYTGVGAGLHACSPLAYRLWRKLHIILSSERFFMWTQRRSAEHTNLQWAAMQDSLNLLRQRASESSSDYLLGVLPSRPKIKLWFTDFWGGVDPRCNWFLTFLAPHFDIELSEHPDFLIYSCYGTNFLRYSCVRIYFTAENIRPDYRFCDYSFSFDFSKDPRNYRLPLYRLYFTEQQLLAPRMAEPSLFSGRKFCNMVVSNAHARERLDFFRLLNARSKVDSGGRTLNNIGGAVENKRTFVHQYRFTIAFENSSHPGYLTEKLFEPWVEHSVPIYWGDPRVEDEINPECFINVMNYSSFEEAVEDIMRINQSPRLYLNYLQAPLFRNNVMPDYLTDEQILRRFAEIFGIGTRIVRAAAWWHPLYYYVRKLKGGSRLIKMDLR